MQMLREEVVRGSVKDDYVEGEKAEDALRKSEEKFRTIFENASDCMIYLDELGRILEVNRKALEVFGGSKEEVLGKHFTKVGVLSPRDIPKLLSAFANGLANRHPTLNISIKNKKGQDILLECLGSLTRISDKPTLLVIARDVTERKRMEEELRESENKYRAIFEGATDGILVADPKTARFVFVNPAICRLTGYSEKELLRLGVADIHPEKDLPYVMEQFKKLAQGKITLTENIPVLRKDRSVIYCDINSAFLKIGEQDLLVGFFRDITERKMAGERIRESAEKYRNLFENARDVILTFDLRGNITSVNKVADEYGFKQDEIIGKNMLKFVSKKFWPRLLKDLAHIARGNSVKGEIEIVTSKGKRLVEYRSNPIRREDKVVGLQAILRDITERKQIEEALRESEERLRQLIEYAPDAIYINDIKGNFIDGNKQAENLTGYKREELIGKNMLKVGLLPKRYVPKATQALMRNLVGQKTGPDEFELIRKDGRCIPVEISTFPVKRMGKIEVIGIARDITERKEMDAKLRQYSEHLEELVQKRTEELLEFEKRYSVLVEEASDGVIMVQDGKTVFANKKALEIIGYSKDELANLPPEKIINEKYLKLVKEGYEGAIRGEIVPSPSEAELITKTGERVSVEGSPALIHFQGRPAVLVIWRDIRERKRMEEQRLRLERLAALGELSTMVGHDLRNPLQSIENAAYYLKSECATKNTCPIPQKAKEMLQVIDDSVNYADKIIRDLQDFSATKKPILKKTDINTVIKEALSQVKAPENVKLIIELDHLPETKVDQDQIKRVFMNLITNGIQAMEKGGTLTVSTKKANGFVKVSFKDRGIGIPKENMTKLFTPFFTTRAKGMGMGLSICKKFVDMHGGSIQVESEAGKGSTFTVKLPISQKNGR